MMALVEEGVREGVWGGRRVREIGYEDPRAREQRRGGVHATRTTVVYGAVRPSGRGYSHPLLPRRLAVAAAAVAWSRAQKPPVLSGVRKNCRASLLSPRPTRRS